MTTSARHAILMLVVMISAIACNNKLVVEGVNYAHPVESVLTPDENGIINNQRYGISFSVKPFQFEEFQDSSTVTVERVRMIRDQKGYYYITSAGFNHVYVMQPEKASLKLKKKIRIGEESMDSPAFNWRSPVVQLVDLSANRQYYLNENGIINREEES